MASIVRTPEFSQCFGDKAALEELTDGAYPCVDLIIQAPLPSVLQSVTTSVALLAIHTYHRSYSRLLSSFFNVFPAAADLLTAVEFDDTGDYLATGDRGGRVVLFERGDDIKSVRQQRLPPSLSACARYSYEKAMGCSAALGCASSLCPSPRASPPLASLPHCTPILAPLPPGNAGRPSQVGM